MGRVFKEYINENDLYECRTCNTHLTGHRNLVSKAFNGRYGGAILFDEVLNISKGPVQERPLTTGLHVVCDVYCQCERYVGWFYEKAYEADQKYKEGKFILEAERVNRKKIKNK